MDFYENLCENPIIAAVKNKEALSLALSSSCEIIFLVSGNIIDIINVSEKIKEAGKIGFAHIDLIEGLARDSYALKYIKEKTCLDGIITTKPNIIKMAKELSIYTVQRVFMLDKQSFITAENLLAACRPNAVEIMPGIIPDIIGKISSHIDIPVIAGGLISKKSQAIEALKAGALAVSTSEVTLWNS